MKKFASLLVVTFGCIFFAFQAQGEEISYTAATDSDGVQRAEILGGSYFFKPNRVIVKVGVPVELKLKKESGIVPNGASLRVFSTISVLVWYLFHFMSWRSQSLIIFGSSLQASWFTSPRTLSERCVGHCII